MLAILHGHNWVKILFLEYHQDYYLCYSISFSSSIMGNCFQLLLIPSFYNWENFVYIIPITDLQFILSLSLSLHAFVFKCELWIPCSREWHSCPYEIGFKEALCLRWTTHLIGHLQVLPSYLWLEKYRRERRRHFPWSAGW